MPTDLALLSSLIGLNYPCLELIFMVPNVFEPLKFDCIYAYLEKIRKKRLQIYLQNLANLEQCKFIRNSINSERQMDLNISNWQLRDEILLVCFPHYFRNKESMCYSMLHCKWVHFLGKYLFHFHSASLPSGINPKLHPMKKILPFKSKLNFGWAFVQGSRQ